MLVPSRERNISFHLCVMRYSLLSGACCYGHILEGLGSSGDLNASPISCYAAQGFPRRLLLTSSRDKVKSLSYALGGMA